MDGELFMMFSYNLGSKVVTERDKTFPPTGAGYSEADPTAVNATNRLYL